MNYESDYAFQTLLLVSRMVSEGDYKTPLNMGMTAGQMSAISDLSSQEIHVLSDLTRANFLSIQFDRDALDVALKLIENKKLRKQKIYELLNAGASYPVMKYIYGLNTSDMASCKKFLGLPKIDGRPSLPSEDDQEAMWKYITPGDMNDTKNLADKLLFVARKTGLKISEIWLVMNRWKEELPEFNYQLTNSIE